MQRNRGNNRKSRFNPVSPAPFNSQLRHHTPPQPQQQQNAFKNFNNYRSPPPGNFQQQKSNFQPQQNNFKPQPPPQPLTDEQIAFELEFTKWEKSFKDWQSSYANHPDREAYKTYEKKFLDVRERLMAKRQQIYQKVPLQMQLEMQLNAAASMAENILHQFGESSRPAYIERPLNPGPTENSGFRNSPGIPGRGGQSLSDYYNRSPPRRDNFPPQMQNFNTPGSSRTGGNFQTPGQNNFQMNRRGLGSNFQQQQGQGRFNVNQRPGAGGGDRGNKNFSYERALKLDGKLEERNRRELARTNVYPNVPWVNVGSAQKPPLVGKRKKQKRAKIVKVLEMKDGVASGGAQQAQSNQSMSTTQNDNVCVTAREKIERLFEEAKSLPCPRRLSGAARKKYVALSKLPQTQWTGTEVRFMEFAEFTRQGREKHFENLRKEKEATQAAPMQTESIAETTTN